MDVPKKMKITRKLLDGASGRTMPTEVVVEIQVKPGWRSGTKITFEGHGNETPEREPGDIIFVVEEKPHPRFTRKGDDLIMRPNIPLVDALCGGRITVEGLMNKEQIPIEWRDPLTPGNHRRVPGKGMPIQNTSRRGDLIMEPLIIFPRSLENRQKQALREALK